MQPSLCFVTGPKPHRLGLAQPTQPLPTACAWRRLNNVLKRRPPAQRADRANCRSDARHLPPGLHAPRMQPPPPVQRLQPALVFSVPRQSLTFLLLFTATAAECTPTPLCLSLSTSTPSAERWPLHPAIVRLHTTALRKDRCSTESAAFFLAEAAFPLTAASGAPPAPSTPPIASPEL
jgi:hypothetical protein